MFQQMLFVHWKSVRFGLLPFIVLAFGLPLLAVQGLGGLGFRESVPYPSEWVIMGPETLFALRVWAPLFPLLAVVTGAVLGLSAWTWDHRGGHVYPLSLPLERWRYTLLKMGAGVVLLAIPCFGLWVGALLATSSLEIPEGLRAYPTAVAVRFFITSLILYALLFSMAAGTLRTTIWVLFGLGVVLVAGGPLSEFLGRTFIPGLRGADFLEWLLDRLLNWPGPFEVITGNWMLIDV